MDQTLVFLKTPAGELAMTERTRVVQRNLRMVLVMVDGQATVGDLVNRIGNKTLVENALQELREGGFIQILLKDNQQHYVSPVLAAPIPGARIKPAAPVHKPAAAENSPATSQTEFSPLPLGLGKGGKAVAPTFNFSLLQPPEDSRQPLPPLIPRHTQTQNGKHLWLKLGIGTCLLLGGLVFFPYGLLFQGSLEKAISLGLGVPTTIASVSLQVLPRPGIRLNNLHIGTDNRIVIDKVILPELLTPFSGERYQLKDITLEGIRLESDNLLQWPGLLRSNAQQGTPYRLGHIKLRQLAVTVGDYTFGNCNGDIDFADDGNFAVATLETADYAFRARFSPQDAATASNGSGLQVKIDAAGWPVRDSEQRQGSLQFDTLNASGLLQAGRLTLPQFSANLLEGKVKGQVALGWKPQFAVNAALEGDGINSLKTAMLLGSNLMLTGKLGGNLSLQGAGGQWQQLGKNLRGQGSFLIGQGQVSGLDLAEATRRQRGQSVVGGTTRFEQLGGRYDIASSRLQLTDLGLQAGLMQARGYLVINNLDKTEGSFTVSFGRTGGASYSRVRVYGGVSNMVAENQP